MKIIAYYLPQFHPIEENNHWWGEGFTEWTNVGKAKKYFSGHKQPKVPKDLGYYDLRNQEVRLKQAKLAKEAGVDAFCYWHYWFGNGKQLLEMPFNDVLKSGEPDFPFCLGWANESWKSKVWDNTKSKKDKLLIEQLYPGKEDYVNHFNSILPALKDKRYFKIEGRPVFVIYKPLLFKDCHMFIMLWNELAKKEGFQNGIHFIAYADYSFQIEKMLELGFNAVNIVRISEYFYNKNLLKKITLAAFLYKVFNRPLVIKYALAMKYFILNEEKTENIYPTIIPNWDHTPRSGNKGVVFHNSNPNLFAYHVREAMKAISSKKEENKIIFLKSWNEWGEGNYMEPDLEYGKEYIQTLRKVKDELKNEVNS